MKTETKFNESVQALLHANRQKIIESNAALNGLELITQDLSGHILTCLDRDEWKSSSDYKEGYAAPYSIEYFNFHKVRVSLLLSDVKSDWMSTNYKLVLDFPETDIYTDLYDSSSNRHQFSIWKDKKFQKGNWVERIFEYGNFMILNEETLTEINHLISNCYAFLKN